MRLLLTSGGLTNNILRNKFLELVGKKASEISVAFIVTASRLDQNPPYVRVGLKNIHKTGVTKIFQIDIARPKDEWFEILKNSDVVWVHGGNTFYLLDKIRSSGLASSLKEIVGNRLYVGESAGSIIVTPSIAIAGVEPGDANTVSMTDFTGMGWVDFEISPHTPSQVPLANIENYAKNLNHKLYAYDDHAAVLVMGDKTEFIGTGFTKVY